MKFPALASLLSFVLAASTFVQAYPSIPHELTEEEINRISKLPQSERVALAERLLEIRTAYEYEKQQAKARRGVLDRRASPSGSYAPANMACPSTNSQQGPGFIRGAKTKQLALGEEEYITKRRQNTQSAWSQWISNSTKLSNSLPGGASNYTSSTDRLPRLGFALSGGGLRAMLVGSGTLQGFDSRNATANQRVRVLYCSLLNMSLVCQVARGRPPVGYERLGYDAKLEGQRLGFGEQLDRSRGR